MSNNDSSGPCHPCNLREQGTMTATEISIIQLPVTGIEGLTASDSLGAYSYLCTTLNSWSYPCSSPHIHI